MSDTFNIAAALANAAPVLGAGRCLFQQHLDTVPDDHPDKGALLDAAAGAISAARMSMVMRTLGFTVSPSTIVNHRRSACPCYLSAA